MTIISKAVRNAGGAKKLGFFCGVNRTTVLRWVAVNKIPPEHVFNVSVASGIPCEELSPDIFALPIAAAVAAALKGHSIRSESKAGQ